MPEPVAAAAAGPGRRLALVSALALTLAVCTGCAGGPETNSLGMAFVRIPAGVFLMGSDEPVAALRADFPFDDDKRYTDLADEAPVHRVHITRDFFLGRHEVTVGQFRAFLQASGHVPESVADGTGGYGYNPALAVDVARTGDAFDGRDPRYSWAGPGFAQTDDHPVTNVTWHDAVAMARWLSLREGATYRLPTEAEWEYACRAGQGAPPPSRFQSGNDPQALPAAANLFDQAAAPLWPRWSAQALRGNDGFAFTAPVGRFAPNAFGLHDMHGNVWEWVSDFYGEDYYANSPVSDPQGPQGGNVRVRRGGSWHTWAFYARCSFRNWNTETTRYPLVGFRLLREVPR